MYVTRPLSLYRRSPAALSQRPPEGPNSGYLVVQDEESETMTCFGCCEDKQIREMPFPQNKILNLEHGSDDSKTVHVVFFIPVLNQPLSSNRYYVIKAHGKHKGEAYKSSREEDMTTCCFCKIVQEVKPRPLDHHDEYQQVKISHHEGACVSRGEFVAKSTAPDGFPPYFLRREGWRIHTSTPHHYHLGEAPGLDPSLRAHLPEFNFPLSCESSQSVVVGKWYCPFMFVKDEGKLKDQMKKSMFYEMTLAQKWEQIFTCDNNGKENSVFVDVAVQNEVVCIGGREDVSNVIDGVIWFRGFGSTSGEEISVGLSLAVVERMKWEQERVGWVGGEERQVRVERVEEFAGMNGWRKFGCYVLVERFALKRMDGSLVLTYDFKHTHQIMNKWE